ncbi:MAG: hypothetical protein A2527_03580 [Candidatus Lambdaproteobacteria bacterium RIFOXYD2_FULL_50_16]|uniref:4a-hydroxytetrahydrobiopterin dehydratase n=1 Tax=Candidatus Lambdaproteobacteria bacterium RIFOXYD2_FULL_50_16 TaxID=1817772 RepID=A0A1F6GEW3_9PROT|nr:MAG: hypothetical protein A2527_03580 [Candidatus Lambdaproteobacteria bacterium RIFOXYD2_FULL_50_16]
MRGSTLVKISPEELASRLKTLLEPWTLSEKQHLVACFSFANFAQGLAFVNLVGALAEEFNHHPDISLSFREVRLDLYSHKLDGLCLADFELAEAIGALR